jgi:hypothetical protein
MSQVATRHAGTGPAMFAKALTGSTRQINSGQEVRMPKLDGNRVALRGRVLPETHARAARAAAVNGLSLSDYLAMLIDRDTANGQESQTRQETLPIPAA